MGKSKTSKSKKSGIKAPKVGYLSRTQAVRHLQVSLSDFRRLCILKGIYPRELTGKTKTNLTKGSTKPITAYNRKDIQYLLHEPLLNKFRDHKIFARKLSRALGRGDLADARKLDKHRPRYTLDHVVKERYPTFLDALGDLDDALSTLFLFAGLPANDQVSYRVTQDAERLTNEWMAYVAREKLLKKVFVSIKGVYYQATVKGQDVIWLVPFKFPQNIPDEVDLRIMLTFLEFYTTLVHFVLYRLYSEAGLIYPPPLNSSKANGVGGIGAYILDSQAPESSMLKISGHDDNSGTTKPVSAVDMQKALDADHDKEDGEEIEEDDETAENEESSSNAKLDQFVAAADGGDELAQPSTDSNSDALLGKLKFFIGREVPLDIVEFVCMSGGAKYVSEAALDELVDNEDETTSNKIDSEAQARLTEGVTHQICDRPVIRDRVPGRVYVQPQWLFDSVNSGKLLPVGPYAPGEKLPPHLSPWGDRGSYDPAAEGGANSEVEEEDVVEDSHGSEPVSSQAEESEDESDLENDEAQRELQLEAAGKPFSETKAESISTAGRKATGKRDRSAANKADKEKELRKMMMTNKQKKLYERMRYGDEQKRQREQALKRKRQKIEKTT